MRRALLALLLAVLPGLALAQAVPVRTGEHGDFTRIVVDFRGRPEWRLLTEGRAWRLSTEGEMAFDLSGIHRRIGRERIRDITQPAPGQLDILLNCDCAPRTYELQNEGLVIDVMKAGEGEAAVSAPLPPTRLIQDLARDMRLPERRRGLASADADPAPEPEADPAPASDRAEDLRASVLAGLARSAEQGMIDLRGRLPEEPGDPAPAPAEEPVPPPALEPGSNIRIETRVERDRRGHADTPPAAACPTALAGGPAAWRDAIREVDLDDPAALARAQAMGLIVRGLGAEAATVLRPYPQDETAAILHEIAQVVDSAAPAPALHALAECSDLLALFSVLADPPGQPARIEPLISALKQFDAALRVQFGRRVIAALEDLGRDEDARIVRNALLRLEPSLTASDFSARQFGPGEPPASEEEALTELIDRTPEAAAALRSLIDGMVRRGEDVPADVLDHAAALAPELPPAERVELTASVVGAEIAQRNLASAARRIDDLRRLDADRATELDAALYAALAGIEEDAVFLQQASRFADRPAPEAAQRLEIARRIAALHVPELGLAHLAEGAGAEAEEDILAAGLWLERNEPERALERLAGAEGPEAERLRLKAARRMAPAPVVAAPGSVTSGPMAVIEKSAALREKYRSLLTGE